MDIVEFIQQFPTRQIAKGEIVLSEGDISNNLFAISDGYIKITSLDDNGNERMLWIAGRYDIVPSEHLFSQRTPLDFFYTALCDSVVYEVSKLKFLEYAKTSLSLMSEIAASMSVHYDDLLLRVNSVEQASVREKLVATLRYLAERFSAETSVDLHKLGLPLTHQDIADMIGSTRETTSVELYKLRQDGFIDYDRTKFIINLHAGEVPSVS